MSEYITEWYWDERRNAPNQAQREEIVRCRDCKCFHFGSEDYGTSDWCEPLEMYVEPDGFCAWGERRQS